MIVLKNNEVTNFLTWPPTDYSASSRLIWEIFYSLVDRSLWQGLYDILSGITWFTSPWGQTPWVVPLKWRCRRWLPQITWSASLSSALVFRLCFKLAVSLQHCTPYAIVHWVYIREFGGHWSFVMISC